MSRARTCYFTGVGSVYDASAQEAFFLHVARFPRTLQFGLAIRAGVDRLSHATSMGTFFDCVFHAFRAWAIHDCTMTNTTRVQKMLQKSMALSFQMVPARWPLRVATVSCSLSRPQLAGSAVCFQSYSLAGPKLRQQRAGIALYKHL